MNLIPSIALTSDREAEAGRLIKKRGWNGLTITDVLAMPSGFIRSCEQIIQKMRDRRDEFDVSYYVFPDRDIETSAPIVETLAGQ